MISTALSEQRCRNHSYREAAARCVQCRGFFCRECISDHEGRSICAPCLRKAVEPDEGQKKKYRSFVAGMMSASAGFLLVWIFFYMIGYLLLSLPDSFHEGTIWKTETGYETQVD